MVRGLPTVGRVAPALVLLPLEPRRLALAHNHVPADAPAVRRQRRVDLARHRPATKFIFFNQKESIICNEKFITF